MAVCVAQREGRACSAHTLPLESTHDGDSLRRINMEENTNDQIEETTPAAGEGSVVEDGTPDPDAISEDEQSTSGLDT